MVVVLPHSIDQQATGEIFTQVVPHLLAEGLECKVPFSGSSMLPTIPRQAELRIRPVSEVVEGRIYLFLESNESERVLVAHRCISVGLKEATFKGDNRTYSDPVVKLEDVIGEVVSWTKG